MNYLISIKHSRHLKRFLKFKNFKKKNYKLGILSNGTPALLKGLIESNNLKNIFDDVFSIEEVGIYKPNSAVYEMPIKKYKIRKEEVVFLSANLGCIWW